MHICMKCGAFLALSWMLPFMAMAQDPAKWEDYLIFHDSHRLAAMERDLIRDPSYQYPNLIEDFKKIEPKDHDEQVEILVKSLYFLLRSPKRKEAKAFIDGMDGLGQLCRAAVHRYPESPECATLYALSSLIGYSELEQEPFYIATAFSQEVHNIPGLANYFSRYFDVVGKRVLFSIRQELPYLQYNRIFAVSQGVDARGAAENAFLLRDYWREIYNKVLSGCHTAGISLSPKEEVDVTIQNRARALHLWKAYQGVITATDRYPPGYDIPPSLRNKAEPVVPDVNPITQEKVVKSTPELFAGLLQPPNSYEELNALAVDLMRHSFDQKKYVDIPILEDLRKKYGNDPESSILNAWYHYAIKADYEKAFAIITQIPEAAREGDVRAQYLLISCMSRKNEDPVRIMELIDGILKDDPENRPLRFMRLEMQIRAEEKEKAGGAKTVDDTHPTARPGDK